MPSEADINQYSDLTFALRDAWPYIHASGSESLRSEASKLMRETGDFAHEAPRIGPDLNRRLFHALTRAQTYVTDDRRNQALYRVLITHSKAQEGWILSGNRPDGDLPPRDLSMRPKEYWETRPSPASPHHWTSQEFHQHLLKHSYPSNTISDRMQVHETKVRDALVNGLYVPPEVIADEAGQRAVADAVDMTRANRYAAEASRRQEVNRKAFLMAAALPGGERALMRELLLGAAKANLRPVSGGLDKWVTGGYKQVQLKRGYPHPIMVCAVEDSKGCRIDFRDGRYEPNSLYSTVRSTRMDDACRIYADLLESGEVTREEVRLVIGSQGMQYLPRPVVQAVYPRGG